MAGPDRTQSAISRSSSSQKNRSLSTPTSSGRHLDRKSGRAEPESQTSFRSITSTSDLKRRLAPGDATPYPTDITGQLNLSDPSVSTVV